MSASSWYILKVASGREQKILTSIEVELSSANASKYVLSLLVPSEKVYEIKNGKRFLKDKVFFPGYIFVEVISLAELLVSSLKTVPGVLGFLSERSWGWSTTPLAMNYGEVSKMLGVSTSLAFVEDFSPEEKSSVRIIDGPFKGLIGIVDSVLKDKKKLVVIINIFDRAAPVELKFNQIEKV